MKKLINKFQPGGVTGISSQDYTNAFNLVGNLWKSVKTKLNKLYTTAALDEMGHPIMQSNGKISLRISTPKKDIVSAVTATSFPISLINFGIPATVGGIVVGGAAGHVGSKLGKSFASGLGLNKNALEMFSDVGGLAIGTPSLKYGINIGKLISNRNLHFYKNLSPYGYTGVGGLSHKKELINTVKSILSGKTPDISKVNWDEDALAKFTSDYIFETKGYRMSPEVIKASRRNAWRLYQGIEQDAPVYLKNSDGTYRYNLDYLKELNGGKSLQLPKNMEVSKHDMLGSSGGNLGDHRVVELGSINPNQDYQLHEIIDTWDISPLKMFPNFEAGPILGGKPFIMKTYIPVTKTKVGELPTNPYKSYDGEYNYTVGFEGYLPNINYYAPRSNGFRNVDYLKDPKHSPVILFDKNFDGRYSALNKDGFPEYYKND